MVELVVTDHDADLPAFYCSQVVNALPNITKLIELAVRFASRVQTECMCAYYFNHSSISAPSLKSERKKKKLLSKYFSFLHFVTIILNNPLHYFGLF